MSVRLWIHPTEIHCQCAPEESKLLEGIGDGVSWDGRRKKFTIPLGPHQLKFLKEKFPNLEVVEGIEYIHRLKHSITNLHQGTQIMSIATEKDLEPIKARDFCKEDRQPLVHQIDGLFYLKNFEGAALFADCGCLAGDSVVRINRAKNSRKITMKEAFYRFHNTWDKSIKSKIRSFKGDHLGLHEVNDIKQSGIKLLFKVTLDNGLFLKATADHEFLTSEGFVELRNLRIGSPVMVDLLRRHQKKKIKKVRTKKGDRRLAVGPFHPYARKQLSHQGSSYSFLLEEHRLVYEAAINSLTVDEFKSATYSGDCSNFRFIDPSLYDIHHINGDHFDNDFSNLVCLSKEDHRKMHTQGKYDNFGHGQPQFSAVVGIVEVGHEMTYDIVCEEPYRNFVANGIVVHNSGKSAMTLWDIENAIQEGRIGKSSALIVGKLMTLETGWESDTYEFTSLNSINLWEPTKSKTVYKEQIEIADHGEKPEGKGKSKSKVVIYKKKEDTPVILRSNKDFNPRRHRKMKQKWKEIKVGEDTVKYGKEYIQEFEVINIRTENMRSKIASKDHNIHIINHESLVKFEDELLKRRYDYIVIDESTVIKNHRSKAFQSLIKIAAWSKYRRVLSGTPSPQGPQDLWSQFFFLDWGVTFGASHSNFISQNFSIFNLEGKDGKFGGRIINPLKPGQKGHMGTFNYIESRLRNRIFRVKLRDCTDLPPLVEMTRTVYLDEVQRKHYDTMEEQMLMELEDGTSIDVTVNVAKVAKLRQITGGFVLNKEKEVKEVSKKNAKLTEFLSLLEEFAPDEKVVIFAEYRAEIDMLRRTLGESAVAIYGGVTDVQKIQAQKEFINNPDKKYIICQPQSAAYGVNGFNKVARYLVFYSLSYQADTIYQAIKRIERTGQIRNMFVYYMIAKDTIDEGIYLSTKNKEATQQLTINVDILKTLKARRKDGK